MNFLHLFTPVSNQREFTHDLGFNQRGNIQELLSPHFKINRIEGGYFMSMSRALCPLSKLSLRATRSIEALADHWPWKYHAFNVFVETTRL